MAHQAQANPGELTWHEGNVWTPDANTPNAYGESSDPEPVSGINLFGKVALQIGKATEELSRTADKIGQLARAVERNTPVNAAVVASGQFVSGSGGLVLNFGSPDAGTFWEICSWAVGGLEVNTTATVSHVGLYTSALPQKEGAGMANLVDWTGTAPYVDHYSPGQIFGNDNENIFCIIYGGTNGQTYVSNIQMRVYNVIASQGQVAFTA